MSRGEVPDKLLKAINSLQVSPDLYPVHRIDIIVLKNLRVDEEDEKETFPELDEFIFSSDLILLSDQQSFLVEKKSIEKAFLPNNNVIKTLNRKETDDNFEEAKTDEIENKILNLPYQYFEKLNIENSSVKQLSKKLENRPEYEVLYSGSWYQPIFNKDLASPVYISSKTKVDAVQGELIIYKERFLHCILRIRLSEKTENYSKEKKISLNNFNELLTFSKVDKKFTLFFKKITREISSLSRSLFNEKNSLKTANNSKNI